MINDALHAYQTHTSYAKVPHKLLRMHLTEIRIFHHLVVLARIFQRKIVLG